MTESRKTSSTPRARELPARGARLGAAAATLLGLAWAAAAELPDTPTLLAALGVTAQEISQIESGLLVRHSIQAGSERELTTGLAFQVAMSPTELVKNAARDLLDSVDENTHAVGVVSVPARASDFSKLGLEADEVKRYRAAEAGGDLNLSAAEVASFRKLGSGATAEAVVEAVRAALLARIRAYQERGLAGIAPYALDDGVRSPADELRTATKGAVYLATYAPAAHALLDSYPEGKPPGTEEIFRWTHFDAHGVPTLALTHLLLVPDGQAWILVKRQFYVSTGYNSEQGTAAFLPSKAGTVVVYGNRTSTDQVMGFGGGAKRSIGSSLLASQLESMFEKARAAAR